MFPNSNVPFPMPSAKNNTRNVALHGKYKRVKSCHMECSVKWIGGGRPLNRNPVILIVSLFYRFSTRNPSFNAMYFSNKKPNRFATVIYLFMLFPSKPICRGQLFLVFSHESIRLRIRSHS